MANQQSKPPDSVVAVWTLVVGIVIAAIYLLQLFSMQDSVNVSRETMRLDERAWIRPDLPNVFPFENNQIPATIKVSNIGKTVATHIIGHVIGTTFENGEHPALDQYGAGYAHMNAYIGALYPGEGPWPIPIVISKYSDKTGEQPSPIVPTMDFQHRLQQNKTYILLFGEIRYCDVFGVAHWVKFCNGSGNALSLDGIKECIYYNRADNDTDPSRNCQMTVPAK